MQWLAYVLVSVIAALGIAVILCEKRNQWPATAIRPILSKLLGYVSHKFPNMLECSACTSFWSALLTDASLSLYSRFFGPDNYVYVPCWPLTGLVALALTWTIIEMMNAIDPK